jgi:hypothetical protein
MMPTRLS